MAKKEHSRYHRKHPLVRINRLCANPRINIYAKLEGFNPTGSIKDRIAVKMIETAEQQGLPGPGKTIIDRTNKQPIVSKYLRQAHQLAKVRSGSGDSKTREHYRLLVMKLNYLFK